MSLFPAYSTSPELLKHVEEACTSSGEESCGSVPAALESQLLGSEGDEERAAPPAPAPPPAFAADEPFYLDTNIDYGNLHVSTLYYPGRPEYKCERERCALGAARARRLGARARRYWQHPAAAAQPGAAATRRDHLRAALAHRPTDDRLWLTYIHFQEEWGAEGAELAAAREAAAACDSRRVRAALHAARARHLPPDQLRAHLRDDLAKERRADVAVELWARLVEAAGAEHVTRTAGAALAHTAHLPAAYPRLLYVAGCVLRAAGLWERLVQLVELTAAMNFPPAAGFPPPALPADPDADERERRLCASGLPRSAVWARLERLRAAAHWRPAPAAAAADADPQRAPPPADAAPLLRAAADERAAAALCAALLRLARVPVLPASERVARAAAPEPAAGEPAAAETLAALARASRRLPAAHPARASPAAARAALAPLLEPPHYFSDATGFLRWTSALWEACCGWTTGARRLALVCWWLRWLHALALLAPPEEAARVRGCARGVLRRHAGGAAAAYCQFARLEVAAGGAAGRAALHAARAALRGEGAAEQALYAARVLHEVAPGPAASWALCCAALRRPLPPDHELDRPPPADLTEAALTACSERCAELEQCGGGEGEGEGEEDVLESMVPGAGEWPAARVALSSPAQRAHLLAHLLRAARTAGGAWRARYWEGAACALAAGAGARRVRLARDLLPLFPRNAYLALACSGTDASGVATEAWPRGERGARAALAAVWPRLQRAPLQDDTEPAEAARLAALCARLWARGAGGALLATVRVEAEARALRRRVQHALYAALAQHPDHKWVYVVGAAWLGAEAGALADAVLERGLRAHALLDELPLPHAQ